MQNHKVLTRQLRKYATDELLCNADFLRLMEAVNDSYNAFDRDKELSDHAFMISESEFAGINSLLKEEIELKRLSINKLKTTLSNINTDTDELLLGSDDDLLEILDLLNNEISKRKQTEKLLLLAKEEAEKASLAKSEFLSIISHEIRTPLNAVLGMGHLLLKNTPRLDQIDNLRTLKTSADNLLILINDILDFNKIEAGKLQFEDASFSVKKVAADIVNANLIAANERQNKLELYIDPHLPDYYKGDALRIGQVLNNLVSNAVKFTNKGSIILSINLEGTSCNRAVLGFNVKDSGVGIAKEKQSSIFSPFTQASTSITRQYGGTGLGLAITKRILMLMNSDIEVRSEPGLGAEFHFTLELPIDDNHNNAIETELDSVQDLNHKRILLVEDTLFNVLYATQLLEGWNTQVDVAENGLLAVEALQSTDFDLILMDLQMPVMDGYTATSKIREFNKSIPIIALTASATADVRERVIEKGMQDYVSKPFNPEDFFIKLKKYLG